MVGRWMLVAVFFSCLAVPAVGADWPQWRGPQRSGVAADSPALVEELPKEGPKKLWTSDVLPATDAAGYGSVAVAGGKAYVYVNHNTPVPWRRLPKGALAGQGYAPEIPAELSAAIEAARVSDARKAIKDDKQLNAWMGEWVKANVKEEQSTLANPAKARLRLGAGALPLETLAKVADLADKRYETQDEAQAALAATGLPADQQKRVLGMMMPEERNAADAVYCFDAETGKTAWTTPVGGQWFYYGSSSTPAVADGRVYVCNSEGRIYGLDAAGGQVLFKSEAFGPATFHHNRSSSVAVIDNVAIASSETCLAGVDAATGATLWQNKKAQNQQSSAVPWTCDGKTYAIVYALNNKLLCIDPKDGQAKWSVNAPGGGSATPTVIGGLAVVVTGSHVRGFSLSADKAEDTFQVEWKDSHSAAVVSGDHAYVVGEAYVAANKARAMCIDLKAGKVAWEVPAGNAQLSSPLVADGKVIAVAGADLLVFRATPEKFTQVAKVNLGLEKWASPCLADGKLYVRTGKNVVCYDLRK